MTSGRVSPNSLVPPLASVGLGHKAQRDLARHSSSAAMPCDVLVTLVTFRRFSLMQIH
jgi:hypothetical protein